MTGSYPVRWYAQGKEIMRTGHNTRQRVRWYAEEQMTWRQVYVASAENTEIKALAQEYMWAGRADKVIKLRPAGRTNGKVKKPPRDYTFVHAFLGVILLLLPIMYVGSRLMEGT